MARLTSATKKGWLTFAFLAFSGLVSPVSYGEPEFTFRGFGTLGAAHNFSDDVEIRRDISQPDGPRGETSFAMDSRLGLQLDTRFSPLLSTTVQAASRYNYRGKFTPEVMLATLKLEVGNYQLRAGRVGWDIYSMSDSRNVGYSFLWVRPPLEYFGKLRVDWLDGGDLRYSRLLGNGLLSAKIYAGTNSQKVALDNNNYADQDGSILYGGHLEYHVREWMVRLSYGRAESETQIRGELDHQLVALPRSQGITDDRIEIDTESVSGTAIYERGPFQLQLMASRDTFEGTAVDSAWRAFTTASYRVGDWTPYFTLARSRSDSPAMDLSSQPGQLGTLVEDQYSLSTGVRYDFRENAALKVQADHFNVRDRGKSAVLWRGARESWDGEVSQLSITLDFIF